MVFFTARAPAMRVRITRRLTHTVDGLDLSQFKEGIVYDVGSALGGYLLATDAAELLLDAATGTPSDATVADGERPHDSDAARGRRRRGPEPG
jgi:hypothetical protein